MALAIKRIHNLLPHLSYVSTLPDITQKPKRDNITYRFLPRDAMQARSMLSYSVRLPVRLSVCLYF